MTEKKRNFFNKLSLYTLPVKVFYALACAPLITMLCECIVRDSNTTWDWLKTPNGSFAFFITSLLVFLAIASISLITTKLSIGAGICSTAMSAMYIIHYFKMQIRGEPFFPWDIYQIKEAAGISSEMDLIFTSSLWTKIAEIVLIILGAVAVDILFRYPKKIKYWYRLGVGLLCAALIPLSVSYFVFDDAVREKHEIEFLTWNEKVTYEKAGVLYAFIENIEDMLIKVPDGYIKKAVLDIAKDYASESGKMPNVIVIMSEAFTDPDIYRTLEFEEDLTPNLDRITKEYLSGRLLTQSFGGGTSISEYEVLTGCSAQFYPSSAVPYMQYVTRETNTYASFLKKLGYSAVAVHPFKRSYWSRDKAYPLLGFEEFYDIDTFSQNCEKPRKRFISDMDLNDKIIDLYENRKSDRIFIFGVSMQNHYAYYPDEYGDITVKMKNNEASALLSDEQKAKICTYGTGVKLADEALGALVDYFETKKEPVVIVFFGDHQPSFDDVDYNAVGLLSDTESEAQNIKNQYTSSYVIWNNFGAGKHAVKDMSMYELLPYMTKTLGLSRPAYYAFLSDMAETMSGSIKTLILDGDGSPVLSDKATEQQNEYIRKLWMLQYDISFGNRYADFMWDK